MMKSFTAILVSVVGIVACVYYMDKIYPRMLAEKLPQADKVLVKKGERTLYLLKGDRVLKTYSVSLGGDPLGHKERQGDSRTPEGDYVLDWRNPKSKYHLSIHVSYPNGDDKSRAELGGFSPGGSIMVHGRPNWIGWLDFAFDGEDWTDGCIAVSNIEMEEIWNSVPNGTPISIQP
jgi:murein L,D-transpeptidase YafK